MFHKSARQKSLRFHKTSADVQKQALVVSCRAALPCRAGAVCLLLTAGSSRKPVPVGVLGCVGVFSLRSTVRRSTSAATARVFAHATRRQRRRLLCRSNVLVMSAASTSSAMASSWLGACRTAATVTSHCTLALHYAHRHRHMMGQLAATTGLLATTPSPTSAIPPAACRAPRSPHAAIRLPLAHTTLGHYHTPPHTLAVIATRRPRRHTLSAIATRSLPSPHARCHRHTLSAIATRSRPSPRAAPRSRPSPHAAIWPPLASRSLPSRHTIPSPHTTSHRYLACIVSLLLFRYVLAITCDVITSIL